MMKTMIEARGADYISRWVLNIARQHDTADYVVLASVAAVTGSGDLYAPGNAEVAARTQAIIGAMTPDVARQVIAHLRAELARSNPHNRPGCHYCGLPVGRDGECEECV